MLYSIPCRYALGGTLLGEKKIYRESPTSNRQGNTIAAKMPLVSLSALALATSPTNIGPAEHPKQPANARLANIAVPPIGTVFTVRLSTPGHRIPTERPHIPQPINPRKGEGDRVAIR